MLKWSITQPSLWVKLIGEMEVGRAAIRRKLGDINCRLENYLVLSIWFLFKIIHDESKCRQGMLLRF